MTETVPKTAAVVLQEMTEMEIIVPDESLDDDVGYLSESEEETEKPDVRTKQKQPADDDNSFLKSLWSFLPNSTKSPQLDNELKIKLFQHCLTTDYRGYFRLDIDPDIHLSTVCKAGFYKFFRKSYLFFHLLYPSFSHLLLFFCSPTSVSLFSLFLSFLGFFFLSL